MNLLFFLKDAFVINKMLPACRHLRWYLKLSLRRVLASLIVMLCFICVAFKGLVVSIERWANLIIFLWDSVIVSFFLFLIVFSEMASATLAIFGNRVNRLLCDTVQ